MKNNWNKLDNAAKIFPAADSKSDSQVFRFSCELNQPIQPELLQHALDNTIRVFPAYQCILKRGLFWYYLESTDMKPVVREEYKPPCSPLYDKNRKSLLFEVTYYRNRIHLEVYHVLSDGTGAMYFLKTLLAKYLAAAKGAKEPSLDYDATAMQMETDSFQKYYNDEKPIRKTKNIAACKLRGQKYNENRLKIITGNCSVKEVLKAAHSYQTTLTAFLCACMMQAISEELSVRAKKKPVILAVPVNLRNFFPSVSARNFFSLIPVNTLQTASTCIRQWNGIFSHELFPLSSKIFSLELPISFLLCKAQPLYQTSGLSLSQKNMQIPSVHLTYM